MATAVFAETLGGLHQLVQLKLESLCYKLNLISDLHLEM